MHITKLQNFTLNNKILNNTIQNINKYYNIVAYNLHYNNTMSFL